MLKNENIHSVEIINEQDRITDLGEIEALIDTAVCGTLKAEGVSEPSEVSVLLVDDEKIRQLNRDFREIDRKTDVLSFPSGEDGLLGDIAISLQTAEEQRKEYGHSLAREVGFLTVHSVLHLLGYDHMTPEEEAVMSARQEEILRGLCLTRDTPAENKKPVS